MDINKLEYFLSVCKYQTFAKAAEKLHVTAQGLNVAINRMEKELNTKLFLRTSKGLVLTDSGYHLKETAENIVGEYYRYQHRAHNQDVITVICMTHVFTRLPHPVQRLLFNLDPAFSVDLNEDYCSVCGDKLLRGEVDFAITVPMVSNTDLRSRKLFSARIVAAVHKESPLAAEEALHIGKLEGVRFITTGSLSKTQQILMAQLQQAGIPPKLAFDYNSPASIFQIVNGHPDIVGILADYFEDGIHAPNVVTKQFQESCMGFDLSLVRNITRVQSKRCQAFEEYLFSLMRSACRQGGGIYATKTGY